MSQDKQKRIEVVEPNTTETTGLFSGSVSIGVVSKDSDLGKFLSSLMEEGENQPTTGVGSLNAIFGKGHSFNTSIGHTGVVVQPTKEQAEQLHKMLEQSRVPRPEHQPLRHPILEAMRARAEAGQHGHSEPSSRHSIPQLLGRGQSKPDLADRLIEMFINDLTGGCGGCTGCGNEPSDVEATLSMVGHLEEGVDLLKLGIKEGMLDEATEDERLALANRLTKMRRKLAKLEGKLRA